MPTDLADQPACLPPARRILVVEDSPLNQMVVTAILGQAGYRADTASNGLEAVMAAQTGGYDLILMDLSMPEMDGLTATGLLRGLPGEAGRVPVVAMTADADEADRDRCRRAGMDDHLAKPVDRAQLLDTVARWLRPVLPAGFAARAPTGADAQDAVLDGEVLTQLAQDLGEEMLADILRQFATETRERVARIATLRDPAALAREAHTLKSTAGTFGARALCAAARALETACRAVLATQEAAEEDGAADGAGLADEIDRLRAAIPPLAADADAAYRAAGHLA